MRRLRNLNAALAGWVLSALVACGRSEIAPLATDKFGSDEEVIRAIAAALYVANSAGLGNPLYRERDPDGNTSGVRDVPCDRGYVRYDETAKETSAFQCERDYSVNGQKAFMVWSDGVVNEACRQEDESAGVSCISTPAPFAGGISDDDEEVAGTAEVYLVRSRAPDGGTTDRIQFHAVEHRTRPFEASAEVSGEDFLLEQAAVAESFSAKLAGDFEISSDEASNCASGRFRVETTAALAIRSYQGWFSPHSGSIKLADAQGGQADIEFYDDGSARFAYGDRSGTVTLEQLYSFCRAGTITGNNGTAQSCLPVLCLL